MTMLFQLLDNERDDCAIQSVVTQSGFYAHTLKELACILDSRADSFFVASFVDAPDPYMDSSRLASMVLFLALGSIAHVYPAFKLGSITRAIMGYSRVWS
jgi:predicted transcriptional regulator